MATSNLQENDLGHLAEEVDAETDFDALKISLASDEEKLSWSYGEVTEGETLSYSDRQPVFGGLFCQRIFGPTRKFMCFCSHLKGDRYAGEKCSICGVDCVDTTARRERMGHIELATPVVHTWYARGTPNRIALLLDLQVKDLRAIINYNAYLVMHIDTDALARYREYEESLDSEEAKRRVEMYDAVLAGSIGILEGDALLEYMRGALGDSDSLALDTGAAAIRTMLERLDLYNMTYELRLALDDMDEEDGDREKVLARLKVVNSFARGGIRPEWMVMTVLPVMPPDLRPILEMESGSVASSDINDLYLRVIHRNNRLKRLMRDDFLLPKLMVWTEKRLVQAAVDALFDNGRDKAATGRSGRPLRSIAEMLKGKPGRFRQNLLGKRVDYSGRSVIVSGPELRMDQCGLPRKMALELFKPFVISRMLASGDSIVLGRRHARRMVERQMGHREALGNSREARREEEIVWNALDEAIRGHPVLLNRAPTLHRLGMQAFYPALVEGNAIKLHPLVTTSFNADFDGDQMAVHLPISKEAVEEAKTLMISSSNMLSPSSGEAILAPSLDMVLGCYYLTMEFSGLPGEGTKFHTRDDALLAHEFGYVAMHAKIWVLVDGEWTETTIGRILFNEALGGKIPYQNMTIDKRALKRITSEVAFNVPVEDAVKVLDGMKDAGFYYAAVGGVTIAMSDIEIPADKPEIVRAADKEIGQLRELYLDGCLTNEELYDHTIKVWTEANERVTQSISDIIESYGGQDAPLERRSSTGIGLYMMASSGAKGNLSQIKQMSGMRGLMADPSGRTIERPIKTSFREGLSVLDYFISSHGARKGLTDTALRTADSGYLTRRLIDVSQYVVVNSHDCGDSDGLWVESATSDKLLPSFEERALSRYAARDILDLDGELVADAGELITPEIAALVASRCNGVFIRSPVGCKNDAGICRICYGLSLATWQLPRIGEAVGIIAAQSIGEPGTQLTMRTFHTGGVAGADITSGLPRVQEIFEARPPNGVAVLSLNHGIVEIEENEGRSTVTVNPLTADEFYREIGTEGYLMIEHGEAVLQGQPLALVDGVEVTAPWQGQVYVYGEFSGLRAVAMGRYVESEAAQSYLIPAGRKVAVKEGDYVVPGDALSLGSKDMRELLELTDRTAVMRYIVDEVQRVYRGQGVETHDKHIEIVASLMLSHSKIIDPGDSDYFQGDLEPTHEIETVDAKLRSAGMRPIEYKAAIQGITRVASGVKSFLSAASFQETTKALTEAAASSAVDTLDGLKENVILGRLIPARFNEEPLAELRPATEDDDGDAVQLAIPEV